MPTKICITFFFASVKELIYAYAQWLNVHSFNITNIALISPLEEVISHYRKYGFELDMNYTQQSVDIMTLKTPLKIN